MTQENTTSTPAKKLLDQVREKIRFKHYSISTEKTYISWIKHYIVFNGKRHLVDMRTVQVETLLIDLNDESLFLELSRITRYRPDLAVSFVWTTLATDIDRCGFNEFFEMSMCCN